MSELANHIIGTFGIIAGVAFLIVSAVVLWDN